MSFGIVSFIGGRSKWKGHGGEFTGKLGRFRVGVVHSISIGISVGVGATRRVAKYIWHRGIL